MNEQLINYLDYLRNNKVEVLEEYINQDVIVFKTKGSLKHTVYCIATNNNIEDVISMDNYGGFEAIEMKYKIVHSKKDIPMSHINPEKRQQMFEEYLQKKINELK